VKYSASWFTISRKETEKTTLHVIVHKAALRQKMVLKVSSDSDLNLATFEDDWTSIQVVK